MIMERIKIVTDSASDIPDEDLRRLNIEMFHIPIAIGGTEYYERKSFTFEEYYDILGRSEEIPKTSRIAESAYLSCYEKTYTMGYQHLVNITISSTGSGTIASAIMARDHFYEKHPEAKGAFTIHIIDSKTYSMAYGYAVIRAGEMAEEYGDIEEILHFLGDWFHCVDIYLGCYTLKYAQKSGRIGATTAFVGELLGMRPIIHMVDGTTTTAAKIRGDRNLPKGLLDQFEKANLPSDTPLFIIVGEDYQPAKDLQTLFKKEYKMVPPIYKAGACIVTNAGPKLLAIVYKGKKRK